MKTLYLRLLKSSLVLLAGIMLLSGCSQEKTYRIGVSQCSRDDWRSKMNEEINREIMFHKDAVVEIRSADDNTEKQIADIRYFADNGFDIIIAAPNEAAGLTPVIKEIYERGIPVIIFDRDIIGDTYTARMGVDNAGIGRSAAHYGRHLFGGHVNVIEIQGLDGSTPADQRHDGFVEGMDDEDGMTLLASVHGDWNKEDAMPLVDSLLKEYPETNLIYAHNDRMAIGASEVAKAHGRDDIKIIGIDAAPDIGIKAVADSVIDATFLYPTEGHRLVRTALAILKGEPYEREDYLPMTPAVDLSNADILLLQNESLKEETEKIKVLKGQVDEYWERHSAQTVLFYASVAILALLFGVIFLMLRAFWQHKSHQRALMEQNRLLEEERDKQERLNEQLKEVTQSKLVFFTNVSHDLRTPLTLVAEPVEQLSEAGNLTPQQQTLVKIANRNIKILKRLINEILDFRKYENGKMSLHLSEVDFAKMVGEWSESFLSVARKRHIKLKFEISQDMVPSLAVDVEKMERVFFNLMSNAFKYTPDNGVITFSCHSEDSKLVFSVADTGSGISAGDIDNIFERFFQVDKVHPKGSGIGLSLAKAFVELHGGSIKVESELGHGSVFTVTLPVVHVEHIGDEAKLTCSIGDEVIAELDPVSVLKNDGTGDSDKPLLLVIDDNADIRVLVSEILKDEYNVIAAPNGTEGIRLAAKYVPDLIICDVMMPGIDGLECCRRIKEEVTTSHIPVLMLTACSMDEQRVQGYDSGADGYLSKPFNNAVLRSRCGSLLLNRKRIKNLWQGGLSILTKTGDILPKPVQVKAPNDIDSEFYARFVEIVQAEMGNSELGVDEIASRMGLGRSQFYRKIKALTNFSPVELLRDMRLQRSRVLLASTEKSISEIAYETGFSTPAYFTKCFRDAFGETPTELRYKLGNVH